MRHNKLMKSVREREREREVLTSSTKPEILVGLIEIECGGGERERLVEHQIG